MNIRALVESDDAALSTVRCGTWDSWDREVQDAIALHLAGELRKGTNRALGLWADDDQLAAVIAWRRYGDNWRITLLAVDLRYRGNGYAEILKRQVAVLAVAEGVRLLFSSVHRDNTAMRHINEKLKAGREVDPKEIDYFLYVVEAKTIAAESA